MIKRSRRPILLLEVMIAIALIVMAAIPLIYPHLYLLRMQRHFMDKVELDHVVNLHYIEVLEKMYKNEEITWASVLNGIEFTIPQEKISSDSYDRPLPFKGTYRFKVDNYKPKGDGGAALTLYLIGLDYSFSPLNQDPSEENTLRYHYDLFVVRDVGDGQLPQGDEEESADESDSEEEQP